MNITRRNFIRSVAAASAAACSTLGATTVASKIQEKWNLLPEDGPSDVLDAIYADPERAPIMGPGAVFHTVGELQGRLKENQLTFYEAEALLRYALRLDDNYAGMHICSIVVANTLQNMLQTDQYKTMQSLYFEKAVCKYARYIC